MQEKMAAPTSADSAVNKPISATESVASFLNTRSVVTSRTRATMFQLQLKVDSERKERQDLQSVFEELKQAKEQANADRLRHNPL